MKRICPLCERISQDGNLWCQEKDCPAETSPIIMGYGDFLGDIQVIRLLYVLRTAAIYQAQRGEERVLLKVAHNGCEEQLKREAVLLAQVNKQHPALPVLLPPYQQADLKQRSYGKSMFHGQTRYYSVFEYVEGSLLKTALLKNPQPWYQVVGWLVILLADVVAFLHVKANVLHLNLSPDRILIRTDLEGIYRPILLDLGAADQRVDPNWVQRYFLPAYTAPELLTGTANQSSDVYGLGLLLYEMLAGHPAFETQPGRDEFVRQAVLRQMPAPLNRADLADEVSVVTFQALDKAPVRRLQDVRALAKPLRSLFGEVPAEQTRSPRTRRLMVSAVFIAFVTTLLIVLAAVL